MSDKIPQFSRGNRVRAMQVYDNEKLGIDAVCGIVLDGCITENKVICFFENGAILAIDPCSLDNVEEEIYQNWKKNGVDTSKTVAERKQLQQTAANVSKLKEIVNEIEKVACGEEQIEADGDYNDSDGMKWIYDRIQKYKRGE